MKGVIAIVGVLMMVSAQDRPPKTAQSVWDQGVAAKGGREALRAVRTFVVRESAVYEDAQPYASGLKRTVVCQPPNGWWEFEDYRPGRFGFSAHVADLETGAEWFSQGVKATLRMKLKDSIVPYWMKEVQLVYFLETAALHPTPIRLVEGSDADAVEVDAGGLPAVVHFDRTTHLPMRIEMTRSVQLPPGRVTSTKYLYSVSSYRDVSGLKLPSRMRIDSSSPRDVDFQVNVDIDPALFRTPPTNVTSPDAWRKFLRDLPPNR